MVLELETAEQIGLPMRPERPVEIRFGLSEENGLPFKAGLLQGFPVGQSGPEGEAQMVFMAVE